MSKNKIFLISGVTIGILLLAIVLIPVLFKGKIISKVKQMADQTMLAKLDFKDADLSVFKNFPQLEISLKQLTVTGIHEFEGKELLRVETLSTSVSLSSLWNSDGLTVSEITLEDPQINLLVNPNGKVNWDIFKPSVAGTPSASQKSMKIDLTRIQLVHTGIEYFDEQSKLSAGFKDGDFELSGFLKGSDSKLKFSGQADSISFDYGGKKFIQGMTFSGDGILQANFDQMNFRFLDNKFMINKLPIALQGTFVMGEKADQFDLSVQSTGASLDELISFLPAEQQKKLKSTEKSGNLSFSGLLKGTYSGQTYPAIKAELKLAGGRLKYPSKSVEIGNITVDASLSKPEGIMDSLKLSVSKLEAVIAGHPLLANFSVITPISNPTLAGQIIGELDFSALKQAIPVDSMEIGGLARANIKFSGPSNAIEKGEYDSFQTSGDLTLQDFFYRSPLFPDRLGIQSARYDFNSKQVTITSMKGKLGMSDFTVDGNIANYWAYVLKNGTLVGNIKMKSDQLDVTQMMNGGTQSKDSTIHSDPYVIPERIDLTVQADVTKMLYNRMEIRNTSGKLAIKDQKLILDNLSMNLLKGKMVISGIYGAKENSPADFNFKMDMKDFDLPTMYQSVGVIRHLLPIAGNSKGTFYSGMSLSGKLGKNYAPDFSALNGSGQISMKNTELVGSNMFAEIGKYFRKDLFTNVKVKDFTSNVTITNGALAISPFTTIIANQEVTVSGSQSLELDLNYQLKFRVNKSDLSSDVTGFIGVIPGTENIEKYPIKIDIAGKIAKPEVKVDLSEAKDLVAREFTKKAGSTLQDVAKKLGFDGLFK